MNQQDAQILVIKLHFPLDALHVSDYISPSSGATFYKLYIAFGIRRYHRRYRLRNTDSTITRTTQQESMNICKQNYYPIL